VTVYLDHAATSPLRPEVLDAYTRALQLVGNPSAIHSAGQAARAMLEGARERIAKVVGCDRNEVIFTSGGTESNNLAIKGLFARSSGNLIITSAAEHHAVLDAVEHLESQGAEVHWLSVSRDGEIDLDELSMVLEERASEVALIALMWVNNETGVITPIREVAALASKHGVPVHSDSVAAFGHTPVNFAESGLATMAITAHKLGGPVGTGALIVSRATKLEPLFHGGGQERALRAGTMDAAGAVAFAVAAETAQPDYNELAALAVELISPIGQLTRMGSAGVPNILSFTFEGCSGESMLFLLDQADIAVSNGSACTAGVARASHVLLAMGFTQAEAGSALRISFGPQTTEADIKALAEALPNVVATARKI
jgi:cysteine desulfurase